MAHLPSDSNESDTKNSADAAPPKSYNDLISTLPTRGGWAKPLVLYQNYWLNPERLNHIIPVKENFKPRRDDIVLATYPKCGTTWLKALAFAVTIRRRQALADDHPLLTVHPQQLVPSLEIPTPAVDLTDIEKLTSPRLLATHLPLSLLPQTVASSGCRLVYLCRDPKDAFVSWWHFLQKMLKGSSSIRFDDAFDMFCEGFSPFGPFWEHYLEYWKESLARPQEVLFLKYEEIALESVKVVRRLATFFRVPFTEEEERRGVPDEVVRLCSFEVLSGLEHNQTGEFERRDSVVVGKSMYFRKGKVGDWENHMSKEMGKKLDDVVEEKLMGYGLVF